MPPFDALPPSSPMRVAVVGGGISGLAAAHRLLELGRERGAPVDVTLLEAAERVGGVFGTLPRDGYLIETGADSFITNKPWAVSLCRRLGLESRLVATDTRFRRSLVLHRGRPTPVPDGFLLLAPARLWPVLRSPLLSPRGKLRLMCEPFIPRRRDLGDESLGAFVSRRLGRETLERIVQPLVGGIYTSDPWKLSLETTMPRFLEMERTHGSLYRAMRHESSGPRNAAESHASGARYGLFATLAGGMSELLDALERRVAEGGAIRRGAAVVSIAPDSGDGPQWTLTLSNGEMSTADAVVLTTHAPDAARLVGFDPELAGMLRGIEYASSAIVVSGHRLADVAHPLDAFGLVIPHRERRRILAVSFTSRKFPTRAPEGRVQLRTFVGGAMQPEMMDLPDDRLLDVVRAELRELLGVSGRPDFEVVRRYERSMPQYHVGHLDRVRRIAARAALHPGLALAGNAYEGAGIPDCIHSAETAAERVWNEESSLGRRLR